MRQLRICLGLIIALAWINTYRASAEDAPLPACSASSLGRIYPSPNAAQDNTLFAAGAWASGGHIRHLYKSVDRGHTWQALPDLTFSEEYRASITLSPNYATDHTISVSFASGANISSDGGQTWQVVRFPRPEPNAFALGGPQLLYAGYGQEIPPEGRVSMELLVSTDGGQNWRTTYRGLEVREIVVSPAFSTDHTLALVVGLYHYNGGIMKSTDAGFTWTNASQGIDLSGDGIESLRFSPQFARDQTLFCYNNASSDWGIYKSANAGESWQYLPTTHSFPINSNPEIVVSPGYAQDETIWYVTGFTGRISQDGGNSWRLMRYPLRVQSAAEYCLPNGVCGVEWFADRFERDASGQQTKYSIYRSYDYGRTWQCLDDPTPPRNAVPTPPAEIPEPSALLLFGSGAASLAAYLVRLRASRKANGI